MTNMVNSGDVYGRAGDWLIGTAKRHPEALLVLAAGCALLVRNGGGSSQGASPQISNEDAGSDGRWQVSRATEKASEVVSGLKDRATDVASSVSDYAGGVGRTISAQTSQIAGQAQSTLQTGFGHLVARTTAGAGGSRPGRRCGRCYASTGDGSGRADAGTGARCDCRCYGQGGRKPDRGRKRCRPAVDPRNCRSRFRRVQGAGARGR